MDAESPADILRRAADMPGIASPFPAQPHRGDPVNLDRLICPRCDQNTEICCPCIRKPMELRRARTEVTKRHRESVKRARRHDKIARRSAA